MQKILKGYVLVKDGKTEVHAKLITEEDVDFLEVVYTAQGYDFYRGSEVKVLETRRASVKMMNNEMTVILKGGRHEAH